MGQYYQPILGDSYGLNCKTFDRSVDSESMSRTASRGLNCSAFYVPCYGEVLGDTVSTVGVTSTNFTLDGKFLLNHDEKQFIDLNEYKTASIDKDGRTIHPLPLLTAIGNGRGSDFHEGNTGFEFIGFWAWQLISIADKPPASFSKIDIRFIETH